MAWSIDPEELYINMCYSKKRIRKKPKGGRYYHCPYCLDYHMTTAVNKNGLKPNELFKNFLLMAVEEAYDKYRAFGAHVEIVKKRDGYILRVKA